MEHQLILDRYRPLEELGEGGFGTVVLAWDTRMQRRVAIKRLTLPLDAYGVPERPAGLAEARTAAMLNHPNIVTVFDFDADDDEAFLVMEFVDGAPLCDLLDQVDGPLTLDEAASVLDDVASALEFAHENGVLHLDVKPDNVLVTRDGRAKVADFGMAALSTLTGHDSAWGGTLGYMPLEQLEGARATERTDEWAYAALAFETLTGTNPYDADTPEEAIELLETLGPPAPGDYVADLPSELDDVFPTALALRASGRYASISGFAEALLTHLGDPAQGRASLAELVQSYVEEPEDLWEEALDRLGLWDRLGGRLGSVLLRAAAAAEAGWLAFTGLAPLTLEPVALWAAVALVAAGGALAPSLGVGLGLGCFVAGLAVQGLVVVAVIVALVFGAWWWLLARRAAGAAVLPLAGPAFGMARIGFLQPLLAGFALEPGPAAATGLLGGALTMLASAASSGRAPWIAVWPPYALDVWNAQLAAANVRTLALSPATWVALAGWPAAAALVSFACARATRMSAGLGAVGGTLLIAGAYAVAQEVDALTGGTGFTQPEALALPAAASLILMFVVIGLGAPVRPGTSHARRPAREND